MLSHALFSRADKLLTGYDELNSKFHMDRGAAMPLVRNGQGQCTGLAEVRTCPVLFSADFNGNFE